LIFYLITEVNPLDAKICSPGRTFALHNPDEGL
jgi:hypothetical protein